VTTYQPAERKSFRNFLPTSVSVDELNNNKVQQHTSSSFVSYAITRLAKSLDNPQVTSAIKEAILGSYSSVTTARMLVLSLI
jgi:hypothetical protein